MAKSQPTSGSGDDAPANAPIEHPGAHIRQLQKQLEDLNSKFDNLSRPPPFRLADLINLAVIAIALIVAFYTASGLAARMDDIRVRQSDAERRMEARTDGLERRLDGRFDRLEVKVDQQTRPSETTNGQ